MGICQQKKLPLIIKLDNDDELTFAVEILEMLYNAPILIDDIDDKGGSDVSVRTRIKELINKEEDLRNFYNLNKLEAGNVGTTLQMVSVLIENIGYLDEQSISLKNRLNSLIGDTCGLQENKFLPKRYKEKMNNDEKLCAVKKLEELVYDAFDAYKNITS